MDSSEHLASYRQCAGRICESWGTFQALRQERLRERERFSHAAEQATESILEDLFTTVLDWQIGDINHQVDYADLMLTRLGIRYVIIEAKRPGSLAWNQAAREQALCQARKYAERQKVRSVAISDGQMLYAADVRNGGLYPRVFCSLEHPDPQMMLWWLSVHGIYRERADHDPDPFTIKPGLSDTATEPSEDTSQLLHPKYKLPVACFAYADAVSDTHTWHLPYLNADGSVDVRRLPKAIQAILSNYRGERISSIPEAAIPDVLVRLARAAYSLGKLPQQCSQPAAIYVQLAVALDQLDRLEQVAANLAG